MRKKHPTRLIATYAAFDFLAAGLAYALLFYFRKTVIEPNKFGEPPGEIFNERFFSSVGIVAVYWLFQYWATDFYRDIYRRSRLRDMFRTLNASFWGSILIFFALFLDDFVASYKDYYALFGVYFLSHFTLTFLFRFSIATYTSNLIKTQQLGFNTLVVGNNAQAADLISEIRNQRISKGYNLVGFAVTNSREKALDGIDLPNLGHFKDLDRIVQEHEVEEIIVALDSKEHEKLERILGLVENEGIRVKIVPDMYNILTGQVKLESIGAPLVEIDPRVMPNWQWTLKRAFDLVVSTVMLALSLPVFLFCMIMIKFTSKGPVFFTQERIGLRGKTFKIIKFRSMYTDAEAQGPQLSSEDDQRITPWGRVMRKYRLDEIPQFINVIIGEMSIVGPRPERKFYMDQIVEKAPQYRYLHRIKPGITSWGMVKFGYAENVDEMVQRMKFDLLYLENLNLFNDLKVLIYTILIVVQGRGK